MAASKRDREADEALEAARQEVLKRLAAESRKRMLADLRMRELVRLAKDMEIPQRTIAKAGKISKGTVQTIISTPSEKEAR